MVWQKVHVFPLERDLKPLLVELGQRRIRARVSEENGTQCLWVIDTAAVEPLQNFIQSGGVDSLANLGPAITPSPKRDWFPFLLKLFNTYPVTLLTIYFGLAGALLVGLDQHYRWVSWLTFQPMALVGDKVGLASFTEGLRQGQWWRLVTPVFLHFGVLHIVFNGLWVWEFGRKIETVFGSAKLIVMFLMLSIFSNLAQYLWSGPSLFGGLSGVLYGLLGFLWIFNLRHPDPRLAVAPGIVGFMILWMVICMTGAVNTVMQGNVANAAHFGGLVGGMLLAVLIGANASVAQQKIG